MVRVTDDKEVKEAVLAGLQRNKEKYGKRYCPCSLVRNDDTVCMCKEFREMEEGMCHCHNLFGFIVYSNRNSSYGSIFRKPFSSFFPISNRFEKQPHIIV